MKTIGDVLKKARELRGYSQAYVAEQIRAITRESFSRAALAQIEAGSTKNPKPANMQAACDVLGIDFRSALKGEFRERTKSNEEPSSGKTPAQVITWETPDDLPAGVYAIVPRVRLFLSAGNGRYATEEELGAPLAFTAQWIHERGLHKKNLVCVNAIGDSMEPRIHCGDTLLVNVGDKTVTDGNVYAIRYGDDLRVKRLFKRFDGGFIIRSDNSAKYPDEIAAPLDIEAGHISVIGRVVWVSGNI